MKCMYTSSDYRVRDRISKLKCLCIKLIPTTIKLFFYNGCDSCQEKRNIGQTECMIKYILFSHINSRCQVDTINFRIIEI